MYIYIPFYLKFIVKILYNITTMYNSVNYYIYNSIVIYPKIFYSGIIIIKDYSVNKRLFYMC